MKYLSQRDPLWSKNLIGASKLTIHDFGCTLTCISMLSDFFKGYLRPDEIAAHKEWFTRAGLIDWSALKLPTISWEKRLRVKDDAEIIKSLKDPKKAVILEVQIPKGRHWLVCIGKELFGPGYRVIDPWTGKKSSTKAYGNLITGSAHFKTN